MPVNARLVCSVQLNADEHSAPDVSTVAGPTTLGVVVVPPTRIAWEGAFADRIVLCSRVEVEGGPAYHWNSLDSTWSTDPDSPCTGVRDDGLALPVAEPIYCPLVTLSPGAGPVEIEPDGDVSALGSQWVNCPPYVD